MKLLFYQKLRYQDMRQCHMKISGLLHNMCRTYEGSNRTQWHSVTADARVAVEKASKNAHKRKHIIRHHSRMTDTRNSVCLMLVLSSTKVPAEHKPQSSVMDSGILLKSVWSLALHIDKSCFLFGFVMVLLWHFFHRLKCVLFLINSLIHCSLFESVRPV